MAKMPLEIRAEMARSHIRHEMNKAAADYDLPGFMVDTILEAILAEERQQRLEAFCAATTVVDEEKTEEE